LHNLGYTGCRFKKPVHRSNNVSNSTTKGVTQGLEPQAVWRYFEEISRIPRCSREEDRIREYILSEAKKRSLAYRTDQTGNSVVYCPATPGYENRPVVVIQGHIDMVCEKNRATQHDFSRDPIALRMEGDWLTANGTTLGADNGIAVAMMLALMDAGSSGKTGKNGNTGNGDGGNGTGEISRGPAITHGPLELLFTVDEETGLVGASGLDGSLLAGKILLNLDSEEEGYFCIGCAGGRNTEGSVPVSWVDVPVGERTFILSVEGLLGGHSGIEIDQGRANAVCLGARVLETIQAEIPSVRVAGIESGDKHNAIPREFFAVLVLPESEESRVRGILERCLNEFRAEYRTVEPGIRGGLRPADGPALRIMDPDSAGRVIRLLRALPHGVISMSRTVPGLVQTSTNLAAVSVKDAENMYLLTSQRSAIASETEAVSGTVRAVLELAGGEARYAGGYPAWPPDPNSRLLGRCLEEWKGMTGTDAEVLIVHAGLECGVIGSKVPGMEMISFGPDITGAHTPNERVSIPSTRKVWEFLIRLLQGVD
jgi:dipeptidase D